MYVAGGRTLGSSSVVREFEFVSCPNTSLINTPRRISGGLLSQCRVLSESGFPKRTNCLGNALLAAPDELQALASAEKDVVLFFLDVGDEQTVDTFAVDEGAVGA